jgi:hypothetical protein
MSQWRRGMSYKQLANEKTDIQARRQRDSVDPLSERGPKRGPYPVPTSARFDLPSRPSMHSCSFRHTRSGGHSADPSFPVAAQC